MHVSKSAPLAISIEHETVYNQPAAALRRLLSIKHRMLLSISTTHNPATDLGYLLHKHPAKVHQKELSFGRATLFYPEVGDARTTAVLAVDVDPVGLVRRENDAFALSQYVNDRPYAASSFLSVAISGFLASALAGRCRDRPELAAQTWPWEAKVFALPAGRELLERLFLPLGYALEITEHALDERFLSSWGMSRYVDLTLRGSSTLQTLLQHLYVLIPVLDNDKHYWIGSAEVDKLIDKSGDWLTNHPARDLILRRYLKNRRPLMEEALARLNTELPEAQLALTADATNAPRESREERVEKPLGLNAQRMNTIDTLVRELGVRSALDLGCGEGKLLRKLLSNKALERIVGVDVSMRVLQNAAENLKLERMNERQLARFELLHSSLIYRDSRLAGFELATVIEVIEHLDPHRLQAFVRVLFAHIAASHILLSTPNVEYNAKFENLPAGQMRHADHRFEWTRAEFETWSRAQAQAHGYSVRFSGIGDVDPALGAPTQLAHFSKQSSAAAPQAQAA